MKITDISVQVIDAGKTMIFADRLIMNLANVVVRVKTDEGVEGVAGASTYLGATGVAAAVAEMKPLLIGEDPLYRERIWQRLNEVSILMVPPHSIAVLDCALWDLAGHRCRVGRGAHAYIPGGGQLPHHWRVGHRAHRRAHQRRHHRDQESRVPGGGAWHAVRDPQLRLHAQPGGKPAGYRLGRELAVLRMPNATWRVR